MMDDRLYDFLEEYLTIFLELINYNLDEDFFEQLNDKQNMVFGLIDKRYEGDLDRKNTQLNNYTKELKNDLFDYVKHQIAETNPGFFNSRINELNSLLNENKNFAGQVGMRVGMENYSLSFEDYYNNYMIAINKLADINDTAQ